MRRLLPGLLVVVMSLAVGCGRRGAEGPADSGAAVPTLSAAAAARAADERAIEITQQRLEDIGRRLEDYAAERGGEPDVTTAEALSAVLASSLGVEVAAVDGWGRPFAVTRVGAMLEIRSLGSDGQRDEGEPRGVVSEPAADIVMIDGGYVQWHQPR